LNIYTLNVGQGQCVVVKGQKEAVIVDTYVPLNTEQETVFVKAAFSKILAETNVVGVIFTGFDDDHFCDVGVQLALNKYRPDWVMYPRYYKGTKTATACFATIDALEKSMKEQKKTLLRHSIDLADTKQSSTYDSISSEFIFEVFSPHKADMNSSNNGSIVCKITERSTGATYLVTGDTEVDRWKKLVELFKGRLKSDVMAAPHHGSRNGITEEVLKYVQPHTVIVSAGIESEYGHPHPEAINLYRKHAQKHWQTNVKDGQSIRTEVLRGDGTARIVNSYKFTV
jgi:beta-lactamase superfamily II metal-dependent hydrolase